MNCKIIGICRNEEKLKEIFENYVGSTYFDYIIQNISDEIVYNEKIDYIIHAAGNASAYAILNNPSDIIRTNTLGTIRVLDLAVKTGARVLATRHITGELARATGLDRLRPVAVMNTGVTGQTGIETGEYILSVVKRIKPTAVIAVDALASRRVERLGCTLQISDAGISPGAGVGNHRVRIDRETIGVPVIAIGVPTVVDARTFAGDLIGEARLHSVSFPDDRQMVVIPREIDLLTDRASRLLGFSLNAAMQNAFELKDLVSLM